MWHPITEQPQVGKRIVSPYNDGSGAALFLVVDAGPSGEVIFVDSDGDEYDKISVASHDVWAYLPDSMTLHFEDRED